MLQVYQKLKALQVRLSLLELRLEQIRIRMILLNNLFPTHALLCPTVNQFRSILNQILLAFVAHRVKAIDNEARNCTCCSDNLIDEQSLPCTGHSGDE